MSTLAREKYEEILAVIARESETKSRVRAYTMSTKKAKKAYNNELSKEFNCALRKVHEKSLSNRKPRYEGPTLEEALAEYYG